MSKKLLFFNQYTPSMPLEPASPKAAQSQNVGSCALLVIQVHCSTIATREEKVANSKLLVNQWRNEPSSRDQLGHHLAFTKSAKSQNVFWQEPMQHIGDAVIRRHSNIMRWPNAAATFRAVILRYA
jgi:hypothetical protein